MAVQSPVRARSCSPTPHDKGRISSLPLESHWPKGHFIAPWNPRQFHWDQPSAVWMPWAFRRSISTTVSLVVYDQGASLDAIYFEQVKRCIDQSLGYSGLILVNFSVFPYPRLWYSTEISNDRRNCKLKRSFRIFEAGRKRIVIKVSRNGNFHWTQLR